MDSPTFDLENLIPFSIVAGIDEAGCGPLAGPVVAAALIFKTPDLPLELLSLINDSKKMSEKKRHMAFKILNSLDESFVTYGIGVASVTEIDLLNVGRATRLAMERAVQALPLPPEFALIDGIRKPNLPCPSMTVIKGDGKSMSIAAASIIAKVTRDNLMHKLDAEYPNYGWGRNAGYGTAAHLKAISDYGITPHHRKSFDPIRSLLSSPIQPELFGS